MRFAAIVLCSAMAAAIGYALHDAWSGETAGALAALTAFAAAVYSRRKRPS